MLVERVQPISISSPLALHFVASNNTHRILRHGMPLHLCCPLTQNSTVTMQKPSSVHALSLDTLGPIFEFAVNAGQTAEETTKTPLAVSQVCSAWRQSALRHAPLWTNVLLGVQSSQSPERAAEFLSRSKILPVCVTFDMQGAREGPPGLKERVRFRSESVV